MPRRKAQFAKSIDPNDGLRQALHKTRFGEQHPDVARCAERVRWLVERRQKLLDPNPSADWSPRVKKAIGKARAAMDRAGLTWEWCLAFDTLTMILNAVEVRDFGFLRRLADNLEGDGLAADPIRDALLKTAMLCGLPGKDVFAAVADVPVSRVVDSLAKQGLRVDEASVRRARRELSRTKKKPGRPPRRKSDNS